MQILVKHVQYFKLYPKYMGCFGRGEHNQIYILSECYLCSVGREIVDAKTLVRC